MRHWFLPLGAALALASAPARAAGPIQPFQVDNWRGGGFTNNQTGQFDHCAMGATYQNGVTLHVSIMGSGQWLLGLTNQAWNLAPGRAVPLEITFDGQGPVRVYAQPRTPKQYVIVMPSNGAVITAFRHVRLMQIYANGHLLGFNLTNSNRLFAALESCVRSQGASIDGGVAPAQQFVAPTPSRRAPPRAAALNPEAKAERDKMLAQGGAEYRGCIETQMRALVPFSNESAEILSQVILTKCQDSENKFVSLGMALFNKPRAEVQAVIDKQLAKQKAGLVAAIVSFRADRARGAPRNAPGPQPVQRPDPGRDQI